MNNNTEVKIGALHSRLTSNEEQHISKLLKHLLYVYEDSAEKNLSASCCLAPFLPSLICSHMSSNAATTDDPTCQSVVTHLVNLASWRTTYGAANDYLQPYMTYFKGNSNHNFYTNFHKKSDGNAVGQSDNAIYFLFNSNTTVGRLCLHTVNLSVCDNGIPTMSGFIMPYL